MAEEFRFGPYVLSVPGRRLQHEGRPVPVGARAFDILVTLIRQGGAVVKAAELSEAIWPGEPISEGLLRVHVARLRRALEQDDLETSYVVTLQGEGYRFSGEIQQFDVAPPIILEQAPLTRLVGREDDLQEAVANLQIRGNVTLSGGGGVGKTALALAAAERIASEYPDGTIVFDFEAMSVWRLDGRQQDTLKIEDAYDSGRLDDMETTLAGKRAVFVLDGCEHVVPIAVRLVSAIRQRSPESIVIATSQVALGFDGEVVQMIDPLPVDDDGPAVELFLEEAAAVVGSNSFTDEEITATLEICRLVHGNPLAIELAAARVLELGFDGVLAQAEGGIDVLSGGRRTAHPRHRSMSAALEWSYAILRPADRKELLMLSRGKTSSDHAAITRLIFAGLVRRAGGAVSVPHLVQLFLREKDRNLYDRNA
ncbi:ATP-binding protein [Rhizobium jaguaris]|uniref:ATP-binding protein n=1 Tax=Rhizobium jaguaris TaxID=1312183 RepID=UPI0013C4E792|nr:winged helix-turn-helix domain-containing protein [Rhizobium jaguaris]